MIAIISRDRQLVEELLSKGADVNGKTRFLQPPLSLAIPDRNLFRLLLSHGAKHHFSQFELDCILNKTNSVSDYLTKQMASKIDGENKCVIWGDCFQQP
jgi:ankyrin repeat protein